MKTRKFKDAAMQGVYDRRRASPPTSSRNGLDHAFRVGLAHPTRPGRYVGDSLAYAAWAAGVDTARALTPKPERG